MKCAFINQITDKSEVVTQQTVSFLLWKCLIYCSVHFLVLLLSARCLYFNSWSTGLGGPSFRPSTFSFCSFYTVIQESFVKASFHYATPAWRLQRLSTAIGIESKPSLSIHSEMDPPPQLRHLVTDLEYCHLWAFVFPPGVPFSPFLQMPIMPMGQLELQPSPITISSHGTEL